MSGNVLSLSEVFCVHRTPEGDAAALQGASLTAGAGELICVLGPSGAGKSTLLRVIAGVETPSAGDVLVLGRDIGRLDARDRARLRHELFGFLGQSSAETLSPDLRVGACVGLPLALRGWSATKRRERATELLERVGLADRSRAWPSELSGGERQRVALCVALAHGPRLLLADEPTGELDAESALAVRELIGEMTHQTGTTTIVVSHDAATAQIADRTLVIHDGRVAEHSDGDERTLVVGADGWVRLPPELLARASIGDRARVTIIPGGLGVQRAGEAAIRARGEVAAPDSPPTWSAARVSLTGVTRARGSGGGRRVVLQAMTGELAPGGLTALTGRSGAGKTTLMRLIAGIDQADEGSLAIDDEALERLDAEQRASLRRERIGYLPQEPAPIPFLGAHENILLSLRLRGWPPAEAEARASAVLSRVGLADRARQRVERLSAGETQRVALARALAGARGLLVVDEPTSRLDRANAAVVADLLAAAAARDGQTVLCATHDEAVIARADAVLAL